MATVDEFYNDPDWEGSSGPILSRTADVSEDLWPNGTGAMGEIDGGDKDVLADGLHPVLAIGPKAQRPRNLTGVVITYNSANDRAVMNLADKVIVRQYVSNVLTYSGGNPLLYDQSLAMGEPVYVDDSGPLSEGVTLSRAPLNESGSANPMAGYIWRCQDQYDDSGVGGVDGDVFPITITATTSATETLLCVMLVNDFGTGAAVMTS
jgi:hypothetical protein